MKEAKWHGPSDRPDWAEDKESIMNNWLSDGGTGILGGVQWYDVPEECLNFVKSQLDRFHIAHNDQVEDVLKIGAHAAFYWIDVMDPYALFWGCSDVQMTDDWANYAYEIKHNYRGGKDVTREADPEFLETYVLVPGQAEEVFEHCLARPGLASLPNCVGAGISDLLTGEYNGEECWDGLSSASHHALEDLCTVNGVVDKKRMMAYFELAAWAGFLWLAGPYGREFRRENNIITDVVLQHGEALLVELSVFPPTDYRRIERAAKSCYRCGEQAWCVTLTQDLDTTRYVCEHCVNYGLPPMSPMHCATTLCRFTSCPHNPFYAPGNEGMYAAARHAGQLNTMARGIAPGIMGAGPENLLLSSG